MNPPPFDGTALFAQRPRVTARQAVLTHLPPTPFAARLEAILAVSSALHHHLCPRQVLGARMGLLAEQQLGLELPRSDKRLMVFVETDGCFADGVSATTGCWLGRRTMRLVDHGKVAATFVDVVTQVAVRITPKPEARAIATAAFSHLGKWQAYLEGYKTLPDEQLFVVQAGQLRDSLQAIIGSKKARAMCKRCGEEIINHREVVVAAQTLCRACAGDDYFLSRCANPST
jgi:formylmethanofuran dehydrogenase subunit E